MGTKIEISLSNGQTAIYKDANIISANVLECANPILTDLPIGTLNFTLHSNTDEFNFLNNQGIGQYIQQGNSVKIYYSFDGNVTYQQLGQYYVDEFDNSEKNQIEIQCSNILGVMDRHIYTEDLTEIGGILSTPIEDCIYSTGLQPTITFGTGAYDGEYYNRTLKYPIIESARNIFHKYLMAFNYDCIFNRDGSIYIFKNNSNSWNTRPQTTNNIMKNIKISGETKNVQLRKIKSVERVETENVTNATSEEIYNNTFLRTEGYSGTFDVEVQLENNYTNYQITNATILESGRCKIKFRVEMGNNASINVIINAKKININAKNRKITSYSTDINSDNVLFENGVASVSLANSFITNKYNDSFTSEMQIIMDSNLDQRVGYRTSVEVEVGKICDGIITELDIDVAGGMIANAKVLCDRTTMRGFSENLITEDSEYLTTENDEYLMTEGE